MKRKINLTEYFLRACTAVLLGLALASAAFGVCGVAREPEEYQKSIVTYYQTTQATTPFDSRCSYFGTPSGVLCSIRLRGVLYRPLDAGTDTNARYPAIIMNHGSGALFEAKSMFCEIANYFAPRGYMVFVPFRRGQGDETRIQDRSTGVYVEDLIQDWLSASPIYPHSTDCTDPKCYRVELFKEQADEDVAAALEYLKGRSDVKYDSHFENGVRVIDRYNVGVFGNSYGGAVTVLFNRLPHDHLAAVAFSPGSQQFAGLSCQPYDVTCQTPMQRALMEAARNAKKPTYYLQAKFDHDTRPTIDLAWAHAYGSPDPSHSRGWAAQIFPYENPCTEDGCDYQSIHEGFIRDPAIWGNSVHDFLRRRGVK